LKELLEGSKASGPSTKEESVGRQGSVDSERALETQIGEAEG
jgi:hypothetical protein